MTIESPTKLARRLLRTLDAETDEARERLFVRSSRGLDPYAKVVLAHELTHAVTDQHYDLTHSDRLAAATGRDDEETAYSALVEGDATLVMQRYLR